MKVIVIVCRYVKNFILRDQSRQKSERSVKKKNVSACNKVVVLLNPIDINYAVYKTHRLEISTNK